MIDTFDRRGLEPRLTESTSGSKKRRRSSEDVLVAPGQVRDDRNFHLEAETGKSTKRQPITNQSESTPIDDHIDESTEIARRRALRAQILAKYTDSQVIESKHSDPAQRRPHAFSPQSSGTCTPTAAESSTEIDTEHTFELGKAVIEQHQASEDDTPCAADFDPDADKILEHETRRYALAQPKIDDLKQLIGAPSSIPLTDIDEFDDMFADPDQVTGSIPPPGSTVVTSSAQKLDESMLDSWADTEGYYRIMIGELLDTRYAVHSILGKGVFSAVVKAIDQLTGETVAIKVIRNNEVMRKAGLKEITLLEQLMAADPDDRKHIVRLKRTFDHRNHLCLVFESLSLNLREVLKKFGRDVGLNLKAVRAYAQQIFLALSLMRKCNIMHADLKPDNILISESRTLLKICDLGSASDISENTPTPYLASRFYRAPEVILGLPYDASMDVWAIGCTLYELYTGKILFPGRTNNQMLRLFMECRGRLSPKLLKKAVFAASHFDDQYNFSSVEMDKTTNEEVVRVMNISKATKDFKSRLMVGTGPEERGLLIDFIDLLERCTELDGTRRLTPNEALKHPFLARTK